MRFRLAIAGALAAAWAAAGGAGAALNPQHAGLQVALRAQGLYLGSIDGIVGPHTVAAVRVFQHAHGLRVTGIADLPTRRELGPLGRPLFGSRAIAHGCFGWDVAVLQFLLNKHGVRVPVNAYMDGPTIAGLRRYQRAMHLTPDGFAGPRTFAALGLQSHVPVRAATLATYVVRSGDSLSAIARRNHTTLLRLSHLNRLDPGKPLLIGTHLRLPASVQTRTAVAATNADTVRASLDRWSSYYGVDSHLAHALAWMESGYNNAMVSNVGAQGVMQILPTTWSYVEDVLIGHKVDDHGADGNIHIGMAYLHHLLGAFGGDEKLALAGWYQGERSVRANGPLDVSKSFAANVLALKQRM
jgi:peptidoglycan hydrolase-like protein with peptidoglycan-binding domain